MMLLDQTSLTCLALVIFLILLNRIIFLFRDPLRSIPGPIAARFSRLWLILVDASGQRSRTIHDLHKEYGHVVRIGPNELSFSSAQAMRDIYGANNTFIKAPVYEAFGRPSSFTIRNKEAHRSRQKRVAHVFAPASIASVESLVREQVNQLLKVFEKRAGQPVDIMEWFRVFALDVVGAVFLGKSFDGLSKETPPQILHDLDDVFPSLWVEWQFSSIRWILLAIPYKPLQRFLNAAPEFYEYGAQAFQSYVSRHGRSGDRKDLLTKLIAGTNENGPLKDDEVVNEMTNLIFAGTDTTSNTFSYMFYEMAKHPSWQDRLHEELDSVDFTCAPAYQDVKSLPILEALVQETLRYHPSAPASLQRLATQHGRTVDDIGIPENTIVSCQSYTTQRDPNVYRNPEEYDPGHWLDASVEQLNLMHEHILVWGKGQRACLGKQLAYMELKLGTAAVMKRYRVELGSPTTDDDMEMTDHFTLIPKGQRCILRLVERTKV